MIKLRNVVVAVPLCVVGALVAAQLPAAASAPRPIGPPPVSHIVVSERTAHRAAISFAVPADYYRPGAGGVVRITRGHTAAASPSEGYSVPVSGRAARTREGLTADVVYTFAVWVRDGGAYSSRRTMTIRTRPDDVSNVRTTVGFDGPRTNSDGLTILASNPHVRLTWKNPTSQPLSQIRIVRNTRPSTTGGKVITLNGSATAYSDSQIVNMLCGSNRVGGCSAARVYYWLLPKSTTGDFAEHYVRTSVVVGSRTLSGTIAPRFSAPFVLCCPNSFDGGAAPFAGEAAVSDGTFTLHLVPGVYAVCAVDTTVHSLLSTYCWSVGPGNTNGMLDSNGRDITVQESRPLPSIDLVHHDSYGDVAFG